MSRKGQTSRNITGIVQKDKELSLSAIAPHVVYLYCTHSTLTALEQFTHCELYSLQGKRVWRQKITFFHNLLHLKLKSGMGTKESCWFHKSSILEYFKNLKTQAPTCLMPMWTTCKWTMIHSDCQPHLLGCLRMFALSLVSDTVAERIT